MPRAAATCAGHDSDVWNTAPLETPWVSESPTVTSGWRGSAGTAGRPGDGSPRPTPSVGSVIRGGAMSVTTTSGGVFGSSMSGGRSLIEASSDLALAGADRVKQLNLRIAANFGAPRIEHEPWRFLACGDGLVHPWIPRPRAAELDPRLPPGQYDTGNSWPVLTAEARPRLSSSDWTFTVDGLVEQLMTWTWEQLHPSPPSEYHGDIHCVTTWSKLGMSFTGVSVDDLLAVARPLPAATHVLARSHTGYTTNLPSPTSGMARRGSPGRSTGSRSPPTMVARRACSYPTCTSGRAPRGFRPAAPRS